MTRGLRTAADTCKNCDEPKLCLTGQRNCNDHGEFIVGPLKGKLPCEVQRAPIPKVPLEHHQENLDLDQPGVIKFPKQSGRKLDL